MKNQKGFGTIETLTAMVIIGVIGGTAWYVAQFRSRANHTPDSTSSTKAVPQKNTNVADCNEYLSFDCGDKAKYIDNYDQASDSLKQVLASTYFVKASEDCIGQNKVNPIETRRKTIMTVRKMVRDEFASVQFCGIGTTSIFAKVGSEWKVVGSLGMAPACSLVDKYKISKQITTDCYEADDSTRVVSYP